MCDSVDNLESNENVAGNGFGFSASQDMFSDDDHIKDSAFQSPKFITKNDTLNSSSILLKTPILCSKVTEETPGRAVVPRTPVDLLPFITKTSVLWTSDMETPEGKLNDKAENCDVTVNSVVGTNTTPIRQQSSPTNENMESGKGDIVSSPILGGKKRAKRKVKRRILNNAAFDLDNNNDQQSTSSSSDKVTSEASSVNNEPFFEVRPEMKLNIIHENNHPNNEKYIEKNELEEAIASDKNSNTSTQDFFCNASFSSIDRLCNNVITNEKLSSISESEDKENSVLVIKQEINDEEIYMNNKVLERVAEIKRNQKPLRRSTDISQTFIPKEIFSKPLRDLELADAQCSQEKKKTPNTQPKSLKLMSFSELTAIENPIIKKEEKEMSPNRENHFVPTEIMNDWNADNIVDVQIKKELDSIPLSNTISEVGFCNANGKVITINEKHLQKCMKMYEEIEKEINSDDFSALGQTIAKTALSKQPISQTKPHTNVLNYKDNFFIKNESCATVSTDFKNETKIHKEQENLNFNESNFLELKNKNNKPNNGQINLEVTNISQEKLIANVKIEDSKLPMSDVKKNVEDKRKDTLKLYDDLDLKEFLEPKFSCTSTTNNDGFATAGGKSIKINEEKERLYSKIYNELDNDENSLLNFMKDKAKKPITDEKSNNKAIITFNSKKSTLSHKTLVTVTKQTIDVLSANVDSDGFSTAGGKGIKISEEKEKLYLKVYNELDGADECGLLNIKQKKVSKQPIEKGKDKALITFNSKQTNINKNTPIILNKKNTEQQSGTEQSYSKVYNELNEDKKKLSKTNFNNKPSNVAPAMCNQKNSAPESESKLSLSSEMDHVFYNLGEVEKLLVPANQASTSKEINDYHGLKVQTLSKKTMNKAITSPKKLTSIKEEKIHVSENIVKDDVQTPEENNPLDVVESNHLSKIKGKLQKCEVKRQERCRSFGGFPGSSNENISSSKLNKSDPYNDSVNQPLHKGLSVSQCFDLHSDSWLSKIELSNIDNGKTKSPEVKNKNTEPKQQTLTAPSDWKASGESNDFSGFSYQDCTDSFRLYANFENFLKRHVARFKAMRKLERELSLESGHTVSISNQTMSRQSLCIQCQGKVDIREGINKSSYVLVESKSEEAVFKLPENKFKSKEEEAENKGMEKRKHADTDSDTPLTTLKKPRTGSELQGRRLFSDESEVDIEEECNLDNLVEGIIMSPPSQPEPTEEELAELAQLRMDAIMQQEKIIRNKRRMKVKPILGSLLKERLENSTNRKSWTDYVGSSVPKACTIQQIKMNHPDAKILEVTASNATCYKFLFSNFVDNKRVVSLDLEDNARLIFDDNGHAGVAEFSDAFLAMPGIDPSLLPSGWFENHYRWIVWKLASIDRMNFESAKLEKALTPYRVMKELKYRYDREIDRAQRPALRKILEKDDVPIRRMVLCVSSIEENSKDNDELKDAKVMLGLPRYKIEVTDGWYSIPLTIDNAMSNYISIGKIKEGTKLMTYGAELLDCERGCFPLDKPANTSLKIYTNCTRRAKWDTKLGYQKNQRPIPVKLRNIIVGGGMVGETTAVAARVYPFLYREKTPDGQSIYRNARSEEKAETAHKQAIEKKIDDMYAQAEKDFESKKKSDFDGDLENSQIESKSQGRVQRSWERKQEELKQRIDSKVRQSLPPPRNVTTVLKIRLIDDRTTAILTIWGVSEDSGYDIKEGSTITIYNAFATGTRGGELNLTANRITHIKTEPLLKLPYPMRSCTLIPDLTGVGFEPKFCEFDTIGVVVSSGPAPHGMKNFEVVNMAYPKRKNSGSSYLSILFWNGISSFGYQGIFTIGAIIACRNLEWRRNTSWNVAVAYCSEKTIFTCNPREQYLNTALRDIKALIQNSVNYAESCVEEITKELSKKPLPRSNQGTPTNWSERSYSASALISPMDNYSPGHASIQKRIEKLSQYGNTVDISPMVLNNSSVKVKKGYTPVTRKNT